MTTIQLTSDEYHDLVDAHSALRIAQDNYLRARKWIKDNHKEYIVHKPYDLLGTRILIQFDNNAEMLAFRKAQKR